MVGFIGRLFRAPIKKIFCIGVGSGMLAYYSYSCHRYNQDLYDRMLYLLEHKVELSGVYLQQRQSFGFIGYLQWLIPYHQSLKIILPTPDGNKERHVGLGGVGGLTSEFVLHNKEKYEYFNKFETSLPIECCVEYYRKTGHFPENVNPVELNKITATTEENTGNPVYNTTFGSIVTGIDGKKTISTCQSAVLWALDQEEKRRLN